MEPEKKEKIVGKKNQPIDWFDLGTKILLGLGSAFIGGMAAVLRSILKLYQNRPLFHQLFT